MSAKHAKTDEARGKRRVPGEAKGRRSFVGLGDRMTKSRLAHQSGIDLMTVTKYLEMAGAPKPDENRKFSRKEVVAWIEANSSRVAGAHNKEMTMLRESKLRTEAEEAAFDFGVKKGRFIEREKLEPGIAEFCGQLTSDLREKFEFELPDRYEGKNAIERKLLNADGIDWVLKRLKQGIGAVVKAS